MNRYAKHVLALLACLSMPAAALAGTYTWTNAVSGNWSVAANWTPLGGPPGVGPDDVAVITAAGANYTVTLDSSPTLAGFTFNPADPLRDIVFSATGRSMTVDGAAGLLSGQVVWYNSTWSGTGTLTNQTDFISRGGSNISCALAQQGDLLIEGVTAVNASLTVSSGFANAGTITLNSTGNSSVGLTVNTGTLTNSSGAGLYVNAGAGGSRTFSIPALTNDGTVNINATALTQRSNAVFTNNGTFQIAGGATFDISGYSQVFNQDAGTLSGSGTLRLYTSTLNYNGGVISTTPRLESSTLNIAPGTPGASFLLWGACNLGGNVQPGQVLTIEGNASIGSASLTEPDGFTSNGTITLTSTAAQPVTLTVNTGTLTNGPGGVLNVNPGPGGPRTFNLPALTNNSTVNINTTTLTQRSNAVFTNNAAFNIADGATFDISGYSQTFTQNAGTLAMAGSGLLRLYASTFNYNGGTIAGTPRLEHSNLNIGGGTGPASFLLWGDCNLGGDVQPGQVLTVEGTSTYASTSLIEPDGFINYGTVTLTNAYSATRAVSLNVSTGTLTNTPGGVLNVEPGTGWGIRTLSLALDNRGQATFNTSASLGRSGADHVNSGTFSIAGGTTTVTGTSFTNSGALTIANGAAFDGSSQTFNQNAGTLSAVGTLRLSGSTLNYNAGTITGTPRLENSTLNIGSGTGPASFLLWGGCTLGGDVQAGQTLTVEGTSTYASTSLTEPDGFINYGTVTLTNAYSIPRAVSLNVSTGTLTNAPGGVLNVEPGTGWGIRTLSLALDNRGQATFNTSASLGRSGANHFNSGTLTIATGTTTVTGSTLTSAVGGLIRGNGTLNVSGVAFANHGTVAPGLSAGTLGITGAYNQSDDGTLAIEVGGTGAGQFDVLSVSGAAALGGKIELSLIDPFVPSAGNTFAILSCGSRSGMFGTVTGRHLPGGLDFGLQYRPTSVTLIAAAPKVGDTDWDGDVDFADYQTLEAFFGAVGGVTWEHGDFDTDGDVDFADYGALEANFGTEVPEPSALALLGAAALLIRRRR